MSSFWKKGACADTHRFAGVFRDRCLSRAADEVDARSVQVDVLGLVCAVFNVLVLVLEEEDELDDSQGEGEEPEGPHHCRVEAHGAVGGKDGADEAKERGEAEERHLGRKGAGEHLLDCCEAARLMDEGPDEGAGDDEGAEESDGRED